MERFVCIHGHFYQPPRENPWLEEVEAQESAHPYHDWNQRVTAECYAPNTASRIIGPDRRIVNIVNNYSMISFNFGPTLLSWMERNAQETYEAILEADTRSGKEFSGHGSAIAQAYSHMIMPLTSQKDKVTQVRWGVADFKARFRRAPEGMWLPETAVDTPTLEALAQEGIKFTILAPHQAKRFRRAGGGEWREVRNGGLYINRPYLCRLPSGKTISIFFYNEAISKEVAFGGLLSDGEAFAKRILSGFTADSGNQLVSVATDGETYGHHHKFGEMALSYCLHYIKANNLARLTNFGEFLEMSPPQDEVEIAERTSWSCEHGIERWMDDCGCKTGVCPLQKWRRPLREAMDWLRDNAAVAYESEMRKHSESPWDVRDDYIAVVLDRSPENVELFFKRNFKADLSKQDRAKILKLLEMQRHSMLMQTSCGWFFDDVSRIETVQIMKHAARVIQLLREVTGRDLEQGYLERLRAAKSNYSALGDGAKIYEAYVMPSKVELPRVGIHHAISSIFNGEKGGPHRVYCYIVEDKAYERQKVGKNALVTGNSRVTSAITLEEDEIWYAALWLGDHNIFGGVRRQMGDEEFSDAQRALHAAIQAGDVQKTMSLIELDFGKEGCACSLSDLFKDRQIEVLGRILETSVGRARAHFQQVYEDNLAVMTFMKGLSLKVPIALRAAAEVVLTYNMVEALRGESDPGAFERLADNAMSLQIELDKGLIGLEAKSRVERELGLLAENPEDLGRMERLERLLRSAERLQLGINYWLAQNILFQIISKWQGYMKAREASGDPGAARWIEKIRSLAELLGIKA
ncbi:MAG: DUF3536 domain-containing protein [Candidatus Methanosuratincola sp.]|nr:DUF3536 domain-containing protein [Candidatus Methanosuratincola sp.]